MAWSATIDPVIVAGVMPGVHGGSKAVQGVLTLRSRTSPTKSPSPRSPPTMPLKSDRIGTPEGGSTAVRHFVKVTSTGPRRLSLVVSVPGTGIPGKRLPWIVACCASGWPVARAGESWSRRYDRNQERADAALNADDFHESLLCSMVVTAC